MSISSLTVPPMSFVPPLPPPHPLPACSKFSRPEAPKPHRTPRTPAPTANEYPQALDSSAPKPIRPANASKLVESFPSAREYSIVHPLNHCQHACGLHQSHLLRRPNKLIDPPQAPALSLLSLASRICTKYAPIATRLVSLTIARAAIPHTAHPIYFSATAAPLGEHVREEPAYSFITVAATRLREQRETCAGGMSAVVLEFVATRKSCATARGIVPWVSSV
ncbi:hypothetical protein C8R46DRAFT_1355807 [Mycena filopes]|nr:hypothetical protein C8R46DRAFT_1355807 [Mycena filopes]